MTARLRSIFRRQIALSQDHGSWGFILSPLLIGLYAAGKVTLAAVGRTVAAMAAFLLRQPVTVAVAGFSRHFCCNGWKLSGGYFIPPSASNRLISASAN